MVTTYFEQRLIVLTDRLATLEPRLERAQQTVRRLETEHVPAGATADATAVARAAQLSTAKTMVVTLEERVRQVQIAITAVRAELEA